VEYPKRKDAFRPMTLGDVEQHTLRAVKYYIDNLPDLPIHVHQMLKIVFDIDQDTKELTKLVSTDPILVSKILQRMNSAFCALFKKVDDLNLAITLLGFREIRNIAIQYGCTRAFGKESKREAYNFHYLWEHSYLVSVCTEYLSQELLNEKAGTFVVLGLLHDIGKFILGNIHIHSVGLEFQGSDILPHQDEVCSLEWEEKVFGINHTIAGGLLARKWNLPESTCVVAEHHHSPSFNAREILPEEFRTEIILTCIADALVNRVEGRSSMLLPLPSYRDGIAGRYLVGDGIRDSLMEKLMKEKKFLSYIIN